jgi:thiamine biosynthesis lipoprotein
MTDLSFDCMGTHARLIMAGEPAAAVCRAFLERFEAALSRFRPDSELCRLNAAGSDAFAASRLLRTAVAAGLWAAERTGGLVDPTLVPALEAAGYDRTRRAPELPLTTALAAAPTRRPAAADPAAAWRRVTVTGDTVRRPPGVRLDTGGTGKGLAADMLAAHLGAAGGGRGAAQAGRRPPRSTSLAGSAAGAWVVDCGGDLRVSAPPSDPFEVHVRHPLTGETAHLLRLHDGAVATSGLNVRLWRGPDGAPRHHILDPATGEPAWTGLIGATALAPTALEAEALAKAALLSGPARAGRWLRRHGGVTVRDDGDVVLHGPLARRPAPRLVASGAPLTSRPAAPAEVAA